jgi:flagellar hook-length control protein FliK
MNISFFNAKQLETNQSKLPNSMESFSLDNLFETNSSPFLNLIENHSLTSKQLEAPSSNLSNPSSSFSQPKIWDEISNPSSKSVQPIKDSANTPEQKSHEEIKVEKDETNSISEQEKDKIDDSEKEIDLKSQSSEREEIKNETEEIPSNIFESISKWFQDLNSIDKTKIVANLNPENSNKGKVIRKENEEILESKKNSTEIKKDIKDQLNETKTKLDSNIIEWEKKIVTTNELFSKLNTNKAKNSEEVKSNTKDKPEIRMMDVKELEKNSFSAIQDVNGKATKSNLHSNETKENIKKTSSEGKSKIESKEGAEKKEFKDLPKITIDKLEKGEIPKDISKWEIRNERSKVDAQIQTQNNSSKDTLAILESNSSSNARSNHDNSRDQGSDSFRSELFKLNTNKKPEVTTFKSNIDPEDVKANMDRLVQKAKIQIINEGRSQAEIRLNPLELGRMVLKISVQNDKVDGKVLVDSEAVKTALQSDLSTLKEDLRAQGLELQSLTIDVDLDSHSDFNKKHEGFSLDNNSRMPNESERFNELENLRIKKRSDSLLDVIA